ARWVSRELAAVAKAGGAMTIARKMAFVSMAFWLAISPALTSKLAASSLAPPTESTPLTFFGMHIHHLMWGAPQPTPWPAVPFGSWRLWDAYVAWPNVEPEKGKWDFASVDKYVSIAEQHHVEVLLPLALSPPWASSNPKEGDQGHPAPPRDIS